MLLGDGIHIVGQRAWEGERFATFNPATGERIAEYSISSRADVLAAVERARLSCEWWAKIAVRKRSDVLRTFARLLNESKRELSQSITRECGKPVQEALLSDVAVAADHAMYAAETGPKLLRPRSVRHSNLAFKSKRGRLELEPYGVIGIISPWNFPLAIPASEVAAALAMGNTVVLKPSEFTPAIALEMEKLLSEALKIQGFGGRPKPLQVVTGDGSTGTALIGSGIDKLVFTGSVNTGRLVAQMAAERLVPVTLELGGKDPMVVLEDADVEVASSAAVWGAMMNAGQACLSVERCYVHAKIADEFVKLCDTKIRKLKVGNGARPDTDVGPLINLAQRDKVEAQVLNAIAQGAVLRCGGQRLPELGANFYSPTLLTGVTHSMRLMQEETFGPVLPIMTFETDEEAVKLANDCQFALGASVFSGSQRHAGTIAEQIQAGMVLVNDVLTGFAMTESPHGGMKASGYGRSHGRIGLEEMARSKFIDVDAMKRMKKPWWYPYAGRLPAMEAFVNAVLGTGVKRWSGLVRSVPEFLKKRS